MAYHAPALAHPDAAALEVVAGLLSARGGTGRLDRALVDTKKAVSVNVTFEELHDPGFITVSAGLSDEQSVDEAKTIVLDTLGQLARETPSAEEVDRSRTRLIQGMDRTIANSQQLALQMTETIAAGDWRLLFTNYEQIKLVTPADVTRVAALYFKDSNRTVGVFVPDSAPSRTAVPQAPGVEELLAAHKPEIRVEVGEALDESPARVEQRIKRSTLPSGFRLALLPKATRGSRVQASLALRFGDEKLLAGRQAAAQLGSALLMRGTTSKSRQQIEDALQALNATITIGGGFGGGRRDDSIDSVTASISTTADNLIPALTLAAEILRDPAFAESDFDQMRQQEIARIERARTDPATLVNQALQTHLSPFPRGDVRHPRTIDEQVEDLKRLTLDDVKAFHRQFYGATQGELVVVGRFDPPAVEKTAASLFGPWKSASAYARVITPFKDVDAINAKIETPDKEMAQFSGGLGIRMRDTDPDFPALVLANYMFGGGGLTARLPDRVRNREGLSYTVYSSFTAPAEGDAALFSVLAIANPGNTPRVEASYTDELARTLKDGFTPSELAAAKKALHDSRVVARSSDNGILNVIVSRAEYGRTLMWDEQMDAKLEAVTLEQVNAAFRRHIDAAKISIVKGGDFNAARAYQSN
jgi:zinc protease